MRLLICALALSALTAFGADVSGKWSGTLEITHDGEAKNSTAFLILKQDGTKISGSIGQTAEKQYPIRDGSIEGDKILLEVVPDQGPPLVKFALKLDGDDHITGDMNAESDEGKISAKIDVKREK
jgi:hypothetical protein